MRKCYGRQDGHCAVLRKAPQAARYGLALVRSRRTFDSDLIFGYLGCRCRNWHQGSACLGVIEALAPLAPLLGVADHLLPRPLDRAVLPPTAIMQSNRGRTTRRVRRR